MGVFEKKHRNPLAGGSFFSFLRNSGDMLYDAAHEVTVDVKSIKLSKDAIVEIAHVPVGTVTTSYDMRRIALAAIDALGESNAT